MKISHVPERIKSTGHRMRPQRQRDSRLFRVAGFSSFGMAAAVDMLRHAGKRCRSRSERRDRSSYVRRMPSAPPRASRSQRRQWLLPNSPGEAHDVSIGQLHYDYGTLSGTPGFPRFIIRRPGASAACISRARRTKQRHLPNREGVECRLIRIGLFKNFCTLTSGPAFRSGSDFLVRKFIGCHGRLTHNR